jgi:tripartite-type tricarboxylate transporter receptor subunit TctC
VADIAAQARAGKPLSYASFGNGTSAHLAGEMLKTALNAPGIVHVPYKGQAPALADLLGGQVTMMFGNWPEFRGHVASGKLVAIGMATASARIRARHSHAGRAGRLESNSWNGMLAPAGVPDEIVQRVNAAVNQALRAPAVAEALHKGGIAAVGHAGAVRRLHPARSRATRRSFARPASAQEA